MEPHLKVFSTKLLSPIGKKESLRYLHTSPELAMKKLLVAGMEKIFQISAVYRNQERSSTHHPEFAMLEWYRHGVPFTKIMDDCENLLRACLKVVAPSELFHWNGIGAQPWQAFDRLTVQDAFSRYTKINLLTTIDDPTNPTPDKLRQACENIGIATAPDDSWEDIFFRIFLEKIEARLGHPRPTFLYDYPICMAALARPKPENPRLAERFELYVCGLELANAFGELTDANLQRERFLADQRKRQALYQNTVPIDEDFLKALQQGLPASAGIALGVDRLVMLATGANHIEDVLWAPVDDQA